MTQDEKLDEALKGTFPASDAFYVPPADALSEYPAVGSASAARVAPAITQQQDPSR
jgi:hypothetical protein